MAMGNVVLAILAKVAAVGVNHGGSVVIKARQIHFVHRNDNRHVVAFGDLLHRLTVGPSGTRSVRPYQRTFLLGAKVRTVEQFLQTEDLHFLFCRGGDQILVLIDHFLADLIE